MLKIYFRIYLPYNKQSMQNSYLQNVSVIIEKIKNFSNKKRINKKLISFLSLKEVIKNKNNLKNLKKIAINKKITQ